MTLAAEAIARMAGETFVLELSAADRQEFGAALVAAVPGRTGRLNINVTIGTQPADIPCGVIVRDPQGRQIWDNNFEARLDRMWPLLRSKLAEHMRHQASAEPPGGQS